MLDPKRNKHNTCCALILLNHFFNLLTWKIQNLNFGFFYQKMAASIVNLKWFRGVCVSTINSTTITKFENEITAPKRTVFFPNSTTAERQPTDTTDSNINKLRLKF